MGVYGFVSELLVNVQRVRETHPLFGKLYPLAVLRKRELYLFEPQGLEYKLVKVVPAPSWMPENVSAAFPLQQNDWRVTAVISLPSEASLEKVVLTLHEFVHCYQWECCEEKLKNSLTVAREEMENGNYMWELNYSFPYGDPTFTELYSRFLDASYVEIQRVRRELREYLSLKNYEYMVWQEWKEGFARYVENLVRRKLQLEENQLGREKPFTRLTFYTGGEKLVKWLQSFNPGATSNLEELFYRMYACNSETSTLTPSLEA